jgi:hypothetical protein
MTKKQNATAETLFDSSVPTETLIKAANAYAAARIQFADTVSARWSACSAIATAGISAADLYRRIS